MLRCIATVGLSLFLMACGAGGAVAPATAPQAGGAKAAPIEPKPTLSSNPKTAGLGAAPSGVPKPAEECAAFAGEAPSSCAEGDFGELLKTALGSAPPERDAALRCLEKASEGPAGLMRALRADLAPRGCGDLVLGDAASGADVSRDVADTLIALGVGARLFRTVRQPPLPRPPFSKVEFLKHFKQVLSPWIVAQAHAVDELSRVAPRLGGYAKGILALEAGLADMRFVAVARAVELPEEMKKDPEIRETYLVTLEQALEPRVARGRDATLVGLGELSRQGITSDARLSEARKLLSELYAGRRIDALDGLLLPPLPPAELDTAAQRIAAKLPAFYAQKLAVSPNVDDPKLLRARLEQGVPPALWLSKQPMPASPELAVLRQRALFQLGQMYFWAEPFTRAAATETPAQDSGAALVAAVSQVLARGPRNAAALMLGPPTLPAELRDTASVDALAKQKGPMAGLAEFDAAYLRGLAPPANDPAFWKEQAARYRRAQKKLEGNAAKVAAELAKAAADTEKELRKQAKP
jgi:hypothetical protein